MSVKELIHEASQLLDQNQNDQAIDVLRSQGPPTDKALYVLLARAYFQRGDTRGDIYSSHYFAERALELGSKIPLVWAILAMSAFRKTLYGDSVNAFSKFVNSESSVGTKFLYGLALMYNRQEKEALAWIDQALNEEPKNEQIKAVKSRLKTILAKGDTKEVIHSPPTGNIYSSIIEHLKTSSEKEIDAPYQFNALSKLRGRGNHRKDFYWLDKNIPCQKACPAGTNIPEYLSAIFQGDYDRAYRINLWDNVFPAVLGRVCSRPCENECRHGWEGLGEPVAICFSKRSGADFKKKDRVVLPQIYSTNGKTVGVIGSGVAGLTAARNLALLGHKVTVFEKHSVPGGMMNQGIPEFRLPRHFIDREVDQVCRQGVEIKCSTEIGHDIPLQSLIEEYDAIVMASGTLRPNILDLPGKELKGIRHGLDFLLEANDTDCAEVGQHVIVIGGGFTAMDCARTALRLGAETVRLEDPATGSNIRVVYRRSKTEMLVTPGELEELNHEGIPMDFMVTPVSFIGNGEGRVTGLRLIRTELGEPDDSGRRRPMAIEGSEFEVNADTILLATGQFPDTSWIDDHLKKDLVAPDKWLISGESVTTAHPKIFVAGDFATGALTLIDAIAHAKNCSRVVDEFLTGKVRLHDVAVVKDVGGPGRIREMDDVPLQEMPMIPLEERTLKAEVEKGYTEELSVDETQRCYLCHYKYEIDPDKCIYCDWCIKAKPRPDCIVKISSLIYDEEERIIGFNRAKESEDTHLIYINQEDCIRCNACVEACPVDCISVQKVSLQTVTTENKACGYDV